MSATTGALPRAVTLGRFGVRLRPRPAAVTAATALAAFLVAVCALTLGDFPISPLGVLRTLTGGGSGIENTIVLDLRTPRVLVGLLVGAGLGVAGALTQTVARNPLASPDVLGVTAGASFGAVGAIIAGGGTYAVGVGMLRLGVPGCALAGGVLAAVIVVGFSWRRGLDPFRLVLVGIGIASVFTALTSWLVVLARIDDAGKASVWLAGSLNARGWDQAVPLLAALAVLLPLAFGMAGALNTAHLGPDSAVALGSRLRATGLAAVALAVALTAAAVAAAGAVGFVGLVVPQVMLRLTGDYRPPLVASAAGGALLVAGADLLSRLVWTWAVPVGLLTAAIGAPYLIWLLIRERRTRA